MQYAQSRSARSSEGVAGSDFPRGVSSARAGASHLPACAFARRRRSAACATNRSGGRDDFQVPTHQPSAEHCRAGRHQSGSKPLVDRAPTSCRQKTGCGRGLDRTAERKVAGPATPCCAAARSLSGGCRATFAGRDMATSATRWEALTGVAETSGQLCVRPPSTPPHHPTPAQPVGYKTKSGNMP